MTKTHDGPILELTHLSGSLGKLTKIKHLSSLKIP
jgi:hypothetical protein